MRTIKFRYTYQHQETGRIASECYTLIEVEREHLQRSQLFVFVDRWQIIARDQFTGLTDKRGEEIYDGDIVLIPELDFNFVVEFIDGAFKIVNQGCERDCFLLDDYEVEIIGNIYEQPCEHEYITMCG